MTICMGSGTVKQGIVRYRLIANVIKTKGTDASYKDAIEMIGKNAPFTSRSFNSVKAKILRMPKKYGIKMKIVKKRD